MLFAIFVILVIITTILFIIRYAFLRRRLAKSVAFFHLYCSSGGGGERVLWHTIKALLTKYPNYSIHVYSHYGLKAKDKLRILLKVRALFKIDLVDDSDLIDRIEFVPLISSPLIEARRYPYFTLLGQNIGSILIALEAACRITPEIYIETIGFTFTLPIFKLLSCKVITYVHYPTISNDMIDNVRTGTHASFNNREIFVRHESLRRMKLIYYKILAYLYGLAGRHADLILVNSTWTQNHINSLWKIEANVVYPPCDIENFKSINSSKPNQQASNALNIISVAQFRPEKNHQTQIEAFDSFLNETGAYDSRLILYGGCRDEEDKKRVSYLRDFVNRLELSSYVEIIVGASFERLIEGMKQAQVAIHTMENEHFGIVLVECMAAGLITVAHNSGGPKTDIIEDKADGLLANDVSEFAEKLISISRMSIKDRQAMIERAVKKSERFSSEVYQRKFIELTEKYFT